MQELQLFPVHHILPLGADMSPGPLPQGALPPTPLRAPLVLRTWAQVGYWHFDVTAPLEFIPNGVIKKMYDRDKNYGAWL